MKGYLLLDLSIKVLEEFLEYAEKTNGEWITERLILMKFPSTEKAGAFLAVPETQDFFHCAMK
jgi:uncharacterized protein (DUF1330 family)